MIVVLNPAVTLNEGDRGDAVKGLQRALLALGHDPGAPDGVYGPATRKAVRAFQQRIGLGEDGIAGRRTQVSLVEALAADEAEQRARLSQAVGTAQGELLTWLSAGGAVVEDPAALQQWVAEGHERLTRTFGQIELALEGLDNDVAPRSA